MKKLIASFLLLGITLAHADDRRLKGTLHCSTSTDYLDILQKNIDFDLDGLSVYEEVREGDKLQVISMSASECEDLTELLVPVENWQKLKKGSVTLLKLIHNEPDTKLETFVSCKWEK